MDVMLLPPSPRDKGKFKQKRKTGRSRSNSTFETAEDASRFFKDGLEPPKDKQMDIDDWEEESGRELGPDDVDQVAKLVTWCYVKWDDLQYEQCE